MKIFILDTYYGDFINNFYQKNPELTAVDYATQKQALLDKAFGTADFYSKNLNSNGCLAEEFIVNNEILQKQWAREHGVKYSPAYFTSIPKLRVLFKSDWFLKILEAQIFEFKPDIIYSLDINYTQPKIFKKAKTKFGSKIVGQIASIKPPQHTFDPYDLLISSLPHYVEEFRSWGKKSEYQPLAFEPNIINKVLKFSKPYPVTHVGGYGRIHNERNETLEFAAKRVKIDFWGYGTEFLNSNSPILKNFHGQSWGMNMYNLLHNSKITLTKHITQVADKYANNATLFEATGCGTLLLTDWKENLHRLFEPGKEIETYRTGNELVDKIRYYLKNEDKRTKIAEAGQQKTFLKHAYKNRAQQLAQWFKNL